MNNKWNFHILLLQETTHKMNSLNVLTARHLQAIFRVVSLFASPTKFLAAHVYFKAFRCSISLISSEPFWYIVYFSLSSNGFCLLAAYQFMSGIGLPIALHGIISRLLFMTITSAGGGTWNWGNLPTVDAKNIYTIEHQRDWVSCNEDIHSKLKYFKSIQVDGSI